MKVLVNSIFAFGLICTSAVAASAQGSAVITGPSSLTDAQPATVKWDQQQPSNCQSGVRVVLTLNNTNIQIGTPVPLSAGTVNVSGPIGVASGTSAALSLMDTCSGAIITPKFPITIVGNAAAPPPAPPANPITPAVRQTIDSDCQSILGLACSTNPTYSSTYSTITQRISQGSLGSDSNSIWSYLLSMVQSSAAWQSNVVDNAWRASGCGGQAPEAQWVGRYAQWQTYQNLYSQMHQAGCGGASANVPSAAAATANVQYLSQAQLQPAYNQVWGGAVSLGDPNTATCPMPQNQGQVPAQAVSCARGALMAWVRAHGNGILGANLVPAAYRSVFGVNNNAAEATLVNGFGINWSGADDLVTYIKSITMAGLDVNGCLLTLAGTKLAPNEQCNMYYLSSQGISTPTVYSIAFNGRMLQAKIHNPFGVLVSNQGIPVRLVGPSGGTLQIQPGGYIVAAGGGNIILNAGGNIVAAGGGNVVNTNGSNLQVLAPAAAARAVGLISNGLPVISNDGGSFTPAITSLIHEDGGGLQNALGNGNFVGNNGSALSSVINPSVVINNNPSVISNRDLGNASVGQNIVGYNSAGAVTSQSGLLTDNGAAYRVQSLGGSQPAAKPAPVSTVSITGPNPWPFGKSQVAVTWKVNGPNPPSCARGYQVMLNAGGLMADGSSHQMSEGMSLVTGVSWPRGSKFTISLYSLCTNPPSPVTAPFSTTIQ